MAQDPDQLADDLATLRSLARSAERTARLMKQIAARADDNMNETLQSQGGHKENERHRSNRH